MFSKQPAAFHMGDHLMSCDISYSMTRKNKLFPEPTDTNIEMMKRSEIHAQVYWQDHVICLSFINHLWYLTLHYCLSTVLKYICCAHHHSWQVTWPEDKDEMCIHGISMHLQYYWIGKKSTLGEKKLTNLPMMKTHLWQTQSLWWRCFIGMPNAHVYEEPPFDGSPHWEGLIIKLFLTSVIKNGPRMWQRGPAWWEQASTTHCGHSQHA